MRTFIIFLAVLGAALGDHQLSAEGQIDTRQSRIMEGKITKISDCLQNLMRNGVPDEGVPVLDPFHLDEKVIDLSKFSGLGIDGNIALSDVGANGFSGWNFDKLKISVTVFPPGGKASIKLRWSQVDLAGQYDGNVSILGNTIEGRGSIGNNATEFGVNIEGKASLFGRMSVTKLDIDPFLGTFNMALSDLKVNGVDKTDVVNGAFAKFPALFEAYKGAVANYLEDLLMEAINAILSGRRAVDDRSVLGHIKQCFD